MNGLTMRSGKKSKDTLRQMKTQPLKSMGHGQSRAKFIAIQSYLEKQGKSKINKLTIHLKKLEKEQSPK